MQGSRFWDSKVIFDWCGRIQQTSMQPSYFIQDVTWFVMLHGHFVCHPLRQDRLAITNNSQLSPSKHYLSTNDHVFVSMTIQLLQLQFHGTHSFSKLMLCCKNGVFQNIPLLFGPRYSLLCSQVCHWILGWIAQGPHPCNPFLLHDKFTFLPSLIADEVFQVVLSLLVFVHFMTLPPHPPLFDQSREVLEESSSKCNSEHWPVCKTPPSTQKSCHLWFWVIVPQKYSLCTSMPKNPFKILCTSSQTLIQYPVLLWSCSWGTTLPVLLRQW